MAEENTKVVVEFLGDTSDIEDKLKALKKVYKNLRKSFNQSVQSVSQANAPVSSYKDYVKAHKKALDEDEKLMEKWSASYAKIQYNNALADEKAMEKQVKNALKAQEARDKALEAKRIAEDKAVRDSAGAQIRQAEDELKALDEISAKKQKAEEDRIEREAQAQAKARKAQEDAEKASVKAAIKATEEEQAEREKIMARQQKADDAKLEQNIRTQQLRLQKEEKARKAQTHKSRVASAEAILPKTERQPAVKMSAEEKMLLRFTSKMSDYSDTFTNLSNGLQDMALNMNNVLEIFRHINVEPIVNTLRSLYDEAIIVSQAINFMGNASRNLNGLIDKLATIKEYGVNLVQVYTTLTNVFGTMAGTGERITTPVFNQPTTFSPTGGGIRFDPNAVDTAEAFTVELQHTEDVVTRLEANLAGVSQAMLKMQWNNGASLQAEFDNYYESIQHVRDGVTEVTQRIEDFKKVGKTNKNFDNLLSEYASLDAVIGAQLRKARQLVEENNKLIQDKQNLGNQYQREYEALQKSARAQREIYEDAKREGDVLKMEAALRAMAQYNTEALELKKRFEDIRSDRSYVAIDNRQLDIAQQYRNIVDDISKKSRRMVAAGTTLEKGLDNNGELSKQDLQNLDKKGLDSFKESLKSVKNALSEISSLTTGSVSKISGSMSKWAGAIGKLHPALMVVVLVLKLLTFLAGQVVQGFTRIMRVSKAIASAFLNAVKPAITIAVKAVKTFVKSLAQFGTNTIKKTLSAPFDLVKKGIKSIESLLSMLRTRIKRRVVAEMFEDLTGSLGAMAEQRDQFNEAMSSMVIALRMFGSQIIAIAQPILEILAPAVELLSNVLTGVADKLSQFTARLNGQDTYFKASEGVYDFATAMKEASGETESATKSAKAYENTVMGFDQLNKLNGTKDGSDSSSKKSKTNPINLKKALTEANALNKLADKIRKALKAKDFKNAGKYIGEAVNDAFSWLDDVAGWEKNADKITEFAKGVIDLVNGFSEGIDPKVIGHAIGDVLNSGIEFVKMLTDPNEGIDFKLIGRNLGEILQNAILTIKWEDLGKAFIQTIQSFVRIAVGFLSTPGLFTDIAIALRDALTGAVEGFNPDDWSDMFSGILNGIGDFMRVTFDDSNTSFSDAGEKLAEMLNKTFEKTDLQKLSSGFAGFIRSLGSFLLSTLTNTDWGDMLGGFVVMLAETLVKIFEDPTGEKDLYTSAEEKGKSFGTALADGLNKFVETIKDRKDTIVDGIVAAIKATMTAVGTFLTESDWGTLLATLINGFFEAMGKLFDSPEKARKFGEDLSAKVRDMFEQLDADTITGGANNFFESIGAFLEGLFDENTVTKIRQILTDIGTKINVPQALLDALKLSDFGLITPFITDIGKSIGSAIFNGIKTAFIENGGLSGIFRELLPGGNTDVGQFIYEGAGIGSFLDPTAMFIPGGSAGKLTFKLFSNLFGGRKANGGYVGDGQMFIANEHGAEAIVRGDGGNTIVTNNQQMIMAITNGVRSAMSDAMRVLAGNNGNGNGGDIVLYVDSEELARASLRGQRSLDKRLNPVIQFA